jgi:hypothetical protein
MSRDFRDEADVRAGSGEDQLVDPLHFVAGQLNQRLNAGAGLSGALVQGNDNSQGKAPR